MAQILNLQSNPQQHEDHYFNSYSYFSIHEEMIKDNSRTQGYNRAINTARHLFRDKVVLDVGCGTGILSMFAANAGAKRVFAVEASEIAGYAKQIVKDNNFEDIITVLHGKIEEIDLPVENVDIIISEWMGYSLFFESMIESVIFARDKWLRKNNGFMFPDTVTLRCAGLDDKGWVREKMDWWNEVYGFNMSAIGLSLRNEPLNDVVQKRNLMSPSTPFHSFDMRTVTIEELYQPLKWNTKINRDGLCDGLIISFDVSFNHGNQSVVISTAPESQPTHWKQTIYYISRPQKVKRNQSIQGTIQFHPNAKNRRNIDVQLKFGNLVQNYTVS